MLASFQVIGPSSPSLFCLRPWSFLVLLPLCRVRHRHSRSGWHDCSSVLSDKLLEQIYRPSFPELNLRQWTGSIYTWLTHPLLYPQKSGRVLMDHLMKLVTTALEWSYVEAEIDVNPKHLEAAAEQLTLRRDVIYIVDGTGQKKEEQVTSEGQTSEAKVQNPK